MIENTANLIKEKATHLNNKISVFWFSLTLPQKLYCLALAVLAVDNTQLSIVALLSLVAITVDYWKAIQAIWDSLLGKAVIIFFYSFIANFAFVKAASNVNEITGVSADYFPYAHNYAVLMEVPWWILLCTLLVLFFFSALWPVYKMFDWLLIRLHLLPESLKPKKTSKDRVFTLIRIGLSVLLLVKLGDWIGTESNLNVTVPTENGKTVSLAHSVIKPVTDPENLNKTKSENTADTTEVSNEEAAVLEEVLSINTDKLELDDINWTRALLTQFIVNWEADTYSRCPLPEGSKAVELNDFEVLEITEDKTMSYGYRFTVKKCLSPAFSDQAPKAKKDLSSK